MSRDTCRRKTADKLSMFYITVHGSCKRGTQVVYHLLRKNRLVDSCSQWDASISTGMRSFHFHDFSWKMGNYRASLKLVNNSKWNAQFRLGIFVYFLRTPVFPRKFSIGETKLIITFTFNMKFPDFLGKW